MQEQEGYIWCNTFTARTLPLKKLKRSKLLPITHYKKNHPFSIPVPLGELKATPAEAYLACYSSNPAVTCFMWADLLNQPENKSSNQTDISSCNLSHPYPQQSYMLDNGQRNSTNEHSEYNHLAMRLCYVLVLTC